MPHPYSEDLRWRVVTAVEAGQTGHAHSKPIGGYRRALLEPYAAALSEQLSTHPSMTLKDVQAWLAREQGLTLSLSAIDQFIRHNLGYRYKKNRGRQ